MVDGLNELKRLLGDLGTVPNKNLAKSVRLGAKIELKALRAAVSGFVDEGYLRKGLQIVTEKPRRKNKKVLEVTFNKKYAPIYRGEVKTKTSPTTRKKRVKYGKGGYYPSSMDYGFKLVNGKRYAGKFFMRKTIDANSSSIKQVIVSDLTRVVDQILKAR